MKNCLQQLKKSNKFDFLHVDPRAKVLQEKYMNITNKVLFISIFLSDLKLYSSEPRCHLY